MLLASLIALVVAAVHFTAAAHRAVQEIPSTIDAAIAREGSATRALVTQMGDRGGAAALTEWRTSKREMLSRVDNVARQALNEVQLSRLLADRLGSRAVDLADQRSADAVEEFRRTGQALMSVTAPAGAALTKLLDGAEETRVHWSNNLDPWTNCHGNGACWQAQFTALLGATRVTAGETSRTMREVRMATPKIAANVEVTTGNVARLTKPESLGMRVIKMIAPLAGGALFGAIK